MSVEAKDDPEISLDEEAESTWEMGKKLGLCADNNDDVVGA